MIRLTAKLGWMIVAALVVSLPALAMTNEESVRFLKLTQFVLPDYPESVKQEGCTSGTVTAVISHDAVGRVTDVLVLDSTHARFAESVQAAVVRWRFGPDTVAGTTHAPLVRFCFTAQGAVMIQATTTHQVMANRKQSDQMQFPTFGALDVAPKALEQPMPVFPAALRGRVDRGSATVAFYVDETGHARAAFVTEASAPEFAEAALAAVGQWRYEAPRQNGRPVVAMENWSFQFGGPSRS
jgi:TonB family protein